MRKTKLLLVAFLAMVGLSSFAKVYEFDQKLTSIGALEGQYFAVVDETSSKAMGIGVDGHAGSHDMYFGSYSEVFAAYACKYIIEPADGDDVAGCYYLRAYSADGVLFEKWGNKGYFNSQSGTGGYFALGLSDKNGQDFKNGAVWEIEVSEGKFALKNKGTGKYLHADEKSNTYDDAFYFTFYTIKEDVVGSAKERYDEIKPMIEALDDDETIFEAGPTVDVSAADAALAAATTVADVDAAIDLLYKAATTFVTSVTVKAGKYFDLSNIWIVNPTVRKNISGWTIENLSATGGSAGVSNYDETEFYQRTFDFFQTLTLPKGTYEFGVTGFHRAGNHSTYFYAGDDKVLIPGVESSVVNTMAQAKEYFDAGNGKVSLKFALEDASNTMKIGIVNNDTETDKWTIFRDFTLHYFGSICDYSVYTTRWGELVTEAGDAKTAHPNVTGTELTDLEAALADAPGASAKKADYIAKIGALETALSAFNAAAPSYDKYVAYRAETVAAFGEDLAATVAAPTTAAEAATAVQSLNIAQYNKVANDYPYSLSSKIGEFSSWTMAATSGDDEDTPQTLNSEHWSGATHTYYEQGKNGWSAQKFTVSYTKTATLPAGNYVIKVAARASGGVTGTLEADATANTVALPNFGAASKGIDKTGAASWTGDNFAKDGTGYGWEWRFLPFKLAADGDVTITISAKTNTQYQWVSIADAELLSAVDLATAIAYDEAANNTIIDVDVANVTITRTIKEGYNTVVLPFDLTQAQVQTAFGAGTLVYAYTEESTDENDVAVKFQSVGAGTITANIPVLIKATAASASQTFEGVQVVAPTADVKVAGSIFDFVGTYDPTTVPDGDYFIGNGAVYKSAGSTSLKAFRAYIKYHGAATARITNFYIDGVETTAIEALEIAGEQNNGKIYNLNGQEVKNAQKGLYIMNGRKVVIK